MRSVTDAILGSITASDHVVVHTNVQLWDVHVVETIEIALRARASGARVTCIVCTGGFSSCPANALHSPSLCSKCNKKTDALVSCLEEHQVQIVSVPEFSSGADGANLVSGIETYRDLKEFRVGNAPIGRLVASQITDDLKDVYFAFSEPVRDRALQHCLNGAALLEWSRRLLTAVGATKVFVWNGRRPSDGPFYYAAESLGIQAFTYISGGRPGSVFVTSAPSVQESPPSEVASDIRKLSQEFATAAREGMSRLDDYRFGTYRQVGYKSFSQPTQASTSAETLPSPIVEWIQSGSTKIFLPSSSPSERIHIADVDALFRDDPYGWIERLQVQVGTSGLALIVRWHPAQNRPGTRELARIHEIADSAPPGVHHILPDEQIDAYFLASESDVVVTTGSTVAVWAAAMGKPVIQLDPRPHFLDNAWTRVSSEAKLWHALQAPERSHAEAAQLWSLYAAERGEPMLHVPWIDDKPLVPYWPKAKSRAVRYIRRFRHVLRCVRQALNRHISLSRQGERVEQK